MTAPTPQNEDRLGRALGYSAAFHVAVFVAFAVRAVFMPSAPMDLQDSIRVDMVALPDKSPAKLPPAGATEPPAKVTEKVPEKAEDAKPVKAEPQPVAKPEPAKPETPKLNLNSSKKSQEAAMRRLEAMQKIERMAHAQEAKRSAEQAAKLAAAIGSPSAAAPVKGNVIASGTSLTGIARQEFRTYLSNVRDQVRSHWNLPPYLRGANLVARVRIFIDSKGFVIKRQIVKSSGNAVFDERVELALDAASPLPPPPSELSDVLSVDGAELDFSPE